ncbi:MAG TPA: SEC-C metal-binding domain-containing protein, partial [Acidimicrobiales bacterium]|nr:SEC-C metal-binding domain-containing protein [Acidimicrobiales bacterium]
IEAKMVTKAVERAQGTVEAYNSEIRKDVLKYDEVMNEQRKVVYKRRVQILEGEDLRETTMELLESALKEAVSTACPSGYHEEWNLEALVAEITQIYPTKFTPEELGQAENPEHVLESILAEGISYYEDRETSTFAGGEEEFRQVEREVMIQIIDQRWREHLAEMDYLREGINLRAMGQQDPLVAWQREGFEMFGKLMGAIDEDYLRYILHVEAVVPQSQQVDLQGASYSAQTDPLAFAGAQAVGNVPAELEASLLGAPTGGPKPGTGQPGNGMGEAAQRAVRSDGAQVPAGDPNDPNYTQAPLVKQSHEKIGRNEPCWCGSGKKFKLCHGAA